MNDRDFKEWRAIRTEEREQMCDVKAGEYAKEEDRLSSFKRAGEDLGLPPEAIVMVYMRKHYDSINAFIRNGSVDNGTESIRGRVFDMMNYLEFMLAVIEEQEDVTQPFNSSRLPTIS